MNDAAQKFPHSFTQINQIFDSSRFEENEKNSIFERIAAILHLGHVEFTYNESSGEVEVTESSEIYISFASQLLNLRSSDLKDALIYRSIVVSGSDIRLVKLKYIVHGMVCLLPFINN